MRIVDLPYTLNKGNFEPFPGLNQAESGHAMSVPLKAGINLVSYNNSASLASH